MTFRTVQQEAIDRITGGHAMSETEASRRLDGEIERDDLRGQVAKLREALKPFAMLAAILSDPADDLPRLMYADWLDENGESERAEFLRIQVESSRCKPCDQLHCWPGNSACSGECGLRRRERQLWDSHGSYKWFDEVWRGWVLGPSANHRSRQSGNLARGFISSICLSWADWLRHHEALYWHPKQTVECPACWPDESGEIDTAEKSFGCETCGGSNNPFRRGTGRIPRPFVATAQPITEVELTTWPIQDSHLASRADAFFSGVTLTRFTRVKRDGQSLNEWTCDKWPTITFKMPTAGAGAGQAD